jgi:hypothetical protein
MHLTRQSLDDAATRGLLQPGQTQALWDFLAQHDQDTPRFKPAHILYYLGGLIAIGAMTLFMNLGWERFRGGGLVVIACAYAACALVLTEYLLHRKRLAIPAGITAVLAVVLVPLAVYGAQHMLGYWPEDGSRNYREYHTHIDWRWIVMELATLLAGVLALWRYRLAFLVMPLAVTLWYVSMDLVPLLLDGRASSFFSERGKVISTCFGLAMLALAFMVDLRSTGVPASVASGGRAPVTGRQDFAFWLYLFGVLAFWGGLTSMNSDSELGKLIYCLINLAMIAVGAALSRRVFAVFGGLGVAFYLGHLSYRVFRDSMLFPLALTAIGLAVIAVGIYWQRHEAAIGARLRPLLPGPLRELVARRSAQS